MGFGMGRHRESSATGIDIASEPIWSHTWQKAEDRIETPGSLLEASKRMIANHIDFSNVVLRSGMTALRFPDRD